MSIFGTTPGTMVAFPGQLVPVIQSGFLERELEEGLDSILAYRREALQETISARIGETLTRSRKGRKAPTTTSLTPSSLASGLYSGLDNGLTPSTFSVEQYTFTMANYGDTVDINLLQELAGVADQLIADARNNGVQAAQSLERIARLKLFSAYLGGNSRVRVDLGTSSTTTAHVDDVRGFQNTLVNGVVTPVSSSFPLFVQEISTSSVGVAQVLQVTGVAVDGVNKSTAPDGQSGVITFVAATAPVHGDALVVAATSTTGIGSYTPTTPLTPGAPQVLRPFARATTALLNGGDVLTLGLVEDAVAYLRDNAVPPMADGTYHCILDNTSMRQLFADQDFKVLFAGRESATEYRDMDVIRLLGVTYIPTTEAYLQQPSTNTANAKTDAVSVKVRRPIVMGAEALIQGNFEGLDIWLNRTGVNAIGDIMLVNNIAQIVRPPLDRLQQNLSMTWTWIGDFAVPTDTTATTTIIPTASNALYKRSVVIEHAG